MWVCVCTQVWVSVCARVRCVLNVHELINKGGEKDLPKCISSTVTSWVTCIHAYMHTCIHAYMHTCIHTQFSCTWKSTKMLLQGFHLNSPREDNAYVHVHKGHAHIHIHRPRSSSYAQTHSSRRRDQPWACLDLSLSVSVSLSLRLSTTDAKVVCSHKNSR